MLTKLSRDLLVRLRIFQNVLIDNIFSLFIVLFLFFLFWMTEQCQDLLVTLNQGDWVSDIQVFVFFATLFHLAFLCWFVPRFYYRDNYHVLNKMPEKDNLKAYNHRVEMLTEMDHGGSSENLKHEKIKRHYREMLPRVLGSLILFVAVFGILNAKQAIVLQPSFIKAKTWLIITIIVLIALNNYNFSKAFESMCKKMLYRHKKTIFSVFVILVISIAIITMFLNEGGIASLGHLVFSGSLLSILFLVFTISRTHLGIDILKNDRLISLLLIIFSLLFILFFLVLNYANNLSQWLNPLICINIGLIFYLALIFALKLKGARDKINYLVLSFIVLVGMYYISSNNQSHEINYSTSNEYQAKDRVTLKTYFKDWVMDRSAYIDQFSSTNKFPIFITSSEGGGSRAAYWSVITQGYWQKKNPNYYNNHLFALTGASGGTTGNSAFFSFMQNSAVKADSLEAYGRAVYGENFLSSSATLLLGRDLWQNFIPFSLGIDRAVVLENQWSSAIKNTLTNTNGYDESFLSFWYEKNTTQLKKRQIPLLFVNTTYVEKGASAVFSPVKIDTFAYQSLDVLHEIEQKHQKTVPLKTTVCLNASFPYVCPVGEVTGLGGFVDAGYYDNYGAKTAITLMQQLHEYLEELKLEDTLHSSLYEKMEIVPIAIINGTVDPVRKLDTNVSQITGPLDAIVNIRSGLNQYLTWQRYTEAENTLLRIDLENITLEDENKVYKPIVPLARYLSPLALEAISDWLKKLEKDANSNLNLVLDKMDH